MAARRIAKSSVDWAALSERVHQSQKDHLRAFKAKSDAFVSRINQHPEKMPPLDFTFYKSKVSQRAMVDEFEKSFKAVSVPFPKDKGNILEKLKSEEQTLEQESQKFRKSIEVKKKEFETVLEKIGSVPEPAHMTMQMFSHYFPDAALNPLKPTLWPHTPETNTDKMLR